MKTFNKTGLFLQIKYLYNHNHIQHHCPQRNKRLSLVARHSIKNQFHECTTTLNMFVHMTGVNGQHWLHIDGHSENAT